ncbi:Mitochondrial substrate/solute carrier [Trinorchestia longiramus]|nr:Mitochondrial substrate/solute carrier [Trinorchestia longiramus]
MPLMVEARLLPPVVEARLLPLVVEARLLPLVVEARLLPPVVEARLLPPIIEATALPRKLPLTREMASGGLAGLCQIVVTTPMELLKIQLQDAGRVAAQAKAAGGTVAVPKVSATSITLKLLKEKGLIGLYKGTAATMLRDVSFSVCYFPLFAHLNSLGPRKADGSGEAVFWCSFLAGCSAGSLSALFVNPFDVVKTRLQVITKGSQDKTYSSIANAFSRILREEGPLAFFKGGACRMIVIAPLFGIAQMVYFFGVGEAILGYNK